MAFPAGDKARAAVADLERQLTDALEVGPPPPPPVPPPPPPLPVPGLLPPVLNSVTVISETQIDLAWSSVQGATSYRVERTIAGSAWGASWAGNALTFKHSGLTPGTEFQYRIIALNNSLVSMPSNVMRATTGIVTPTPPGPPLPPPPSGSGWEKAKRAGAPDVIGTATLNWPTSAATILDSGKIIRVAGSSWGAPNATNVDLTSCTIIGGPARTAFGYRGKIKLTLCEIRGFVDGSKIPSGGIVFDGVHIHALVSSYGGEGHGDCVQKDDPTNAVGSRIRNCWFEAINNANYQSDGFSDVLEISDSRFQGPVNARLFLYDKGSDIPHRVALNNLELDVAGVKHNLIGTQRQIAIESQAIDPAQLPTGDTAIHCFNVRDLSGHVFTASELKAARS